MLYEDLSGVFKTTYSDLLQALEYEGIEKHSKAGREGTFVKRKIKDREYWYLQISGEKKLEYVYIGPDSQELQTAIREAKNMREAIQPLRASLMATGGFRFVRQASDILSLLGDSGLFSSGAVLVGTNAFLSYQNAFGIRWKPLSIETLHTRDIDFAQFNRFKVGVPLNVAENMKNALNVLKANPIWKSLNNKGMPSVYQISDREKFDIEFLTPLIGEDHEKTVPLPWIGVGAQPLRFMDYLIEGDFHAVALVDKGAVLINLPDPGRFALHKLIVHERRSPSSAIKKDKDLAQSGAMIAFLSDKHPEMLERAWQDLSNKHKTWRQIVQKGVKKLPGELKNTPVISAILKANLSGRKSTHS